MENQRKFNIAIVGPNASGKTTLINRLKFGDDIPLNYETTSNDKDTETHTFNIQLNDGPLTLNLIEVSKSFIKCNEDLVYVNNNKIHVDCIILIFDTTSLESLNQSSLIKYEALGTFGKDKPIILVGNNEDSVYKKDVVKYMNYYPLYKNHVNAKDLITYILRYVYYNNGICINSQIPFEH